MQITETIYYAGVNDTTIDLFEGQYRVPAGISYNSYVIMDEKIAVMDTADQRKTTEWMENLNEILGDRTPDYLIVSHMEPDHSAGVALLAAAYPGMKLVGNAKTFQMISQFFGTDYSDRAVIVAEGEKLSLGKHILSFYMAPMVHWPEVMVTYEETEKILFSADGFGKFGALDEEDPWSIANPETEWDPEARRYYLNIVGKYGMQVQALLKKAAGLEIIKICPLHGPILQENLQHYLEKYNAWSSYEPEQKGVLVAYASIYGNTKKAAEEVAEQLKAAGTECVEIRDLARSDMAEVLGQAFRLDRMVLAAPTYDGGIYPVMEEFLTHLKSKSYQKRAVALVENGTWAPMTGRLMRAKLEEMKNITVCEQVVSIRSAMTATNKQEIGKCIEWLQQNIL
ncbi:MAG: FprA family A-type flavoprotein [Lachnospiraceae bacterium]|nr:FprA family A-type flavoprotein [Lachnospiraceae bacterium]